VPGLRFVDAASGALGIEWIDGKSIRSLLGSGDEGEETEDEDDVALAEDEDFLTEYRVPKGMNLSHSCQVTDLRHDSDTLMVMVGAEIAKMHLADIIHGDLTTSNMMMRHPSAMANFPDTHQLVREHTISLHTHLGSTQKIRFSLTLGWLILLRWQRTKQ
jgi:TP53 regulating kinase-like protein